MTWNGNHQLWFFESIPAGISQGVEITKDYLKQFKLFFRPETKAYESLGGFATIGKHFPFHMGLACFLEYDSFYFYYSGYYEPSSHTCTRWRTCNVSDHLK
jgi:hypothetical protein